MRKNVSTLDRGLRGLGSVVSIGSAMLVPFAWEARAALGATGVYLLYTALAGSCLGYRMMGLSTCPAEQR